MQFHMIAPAFLVLTIALSWPRFSSIFRGDTQTAVATAPLTTVASAECLSALALAFTDNELGGGTLIAALGVVLASTMQASRPTFAISLSAISLAVYLQFGSARVL